MKTTLHRLSLLVALSLLAIHPRVEAQTQATLTTIHSFLGPSGEGSNPIAALVQGSDGAFYGTTLNGGSNNDGTVFNVTADGSSFSTLYSFQTVSTDGETPAAPLIEGSDHAFYGTTQGSGSNPGTIFKITAAGDLDTLYDFTSQVSNGNHPQAQLTEGGDGNFYGTTSSGGFGSDGTFFQLTPQGVITFLYEFSGDDGASPIGPVVLGSDGNFYGTTFSGGANNAGTVYRMTPTGALKTLHSFTSNGAGGDGSSVRGGLVLGSDGALYGTTETGGTNNKGTVFKITMAGEFKSLHSFSATNPSTGTNADGAIPYAGLSVGSDGNLYGATGGGGSHNAGTLFRITPAGTLTSLYSFTVPGSGFVNADGATPYAPPVEGRDGNFYGTTYVGGSSGKGVVYQMKLAPVITSPTTATAYAGKAFSYQIEAAFHPASYAATGLPSGLHVNASTGLISGTPTATGAKTITLQATNTIGTGEKTLTLTIAKAAPPVITSADTATATTGQAFSYQITASNGPTSFGATGLPSGLTVNKTTGLISGAPASTASGSKTIHLTATNAFGTGDAALTLDILAPPVITSATTASATVGKAFSYQITASHDPTSFGATGLPSGLTVNSQGLISGTPASTASGTKTLHLTATNSAGTGTATLTLTILGVPKITSPTTASATAGKPFTYQITATNTPASFNATGRPSGLTVDTKTGLISGTPAITSVGAKTLTLTATNAAGTGEESLTLTISK